MQLKRTMTNFLIQGKVLEVVKYRVSKCPQPGFVRKTAIGFHIVTGNF